MAAGDARPYPNGMTQAQTARVTLVTIIGASELQDRLLDDVRSAGARGYTFAQVGGGGLHGPRRRGLWEVGNVRIELLVSREVATRVLACVDENYKGQSVIAFQQEVEAAPHEHFTREAGSG